MSERDLARFVDELGGNNVSEAVKRRSFVRWPYPKSVAVGIRQGGSGGLVLIAMACRNISSGGIALLHSSFAHDGSPVRVCLKKTTGQIVAIDGKIVHCRHLRGTTHEIGVQFESSIDPREFLSLDGLADSFTVEHVDPGTLEGCVLAIDGSDTDLRLIQHFMQGTRVRFRTASTIEEGLSKAAEGCDLILCAHELGGTNGAELIRGLRRAGHLAPVLIMTPDTTIDEKLLEARADAILAKPIARETLLRALAEFMLSRERDLQRTTTLAGDHPNLKFVVDWVGQLDTCAEKLEQALEHNDAETCRGLCLQLADTGPTLGFQALADIANEAAQVVASDVSTVYAVRAVRRLVVACRRTEVDTDAA
ncbi:MAG: PilZ domain-containing protein [Planctomycetes bacterium]|nr:PilZ domain-containing protein [Planctomycetota bacterium]